MDTEKIKILIRTIELSLDKIKEELYKDNQSTKKIKKEKSQKKYDECKKSVSENLDKMEKLNYSDNTDDDIYDLITTGKYSMPDDFEGLWKRQKNYSNY